MVTRDTPYLTAHTLLDVVDKHILRLLSLGWYLFTVVSHDGYLTKVIIKMHILLLQMLMYCIPLATIPFSDFVIFSEIHLEKNPNWSVCVDFKNLNSVKIS